jgi:hypothetical protein
MFTYWPFVSLVVMGVMVTILLLLKFADKICRARMTATEGFVERQYDDDQVHPLEMLEDGAGTMMDFNLQESGSVRSQRTLNSQLLPRQRDRPARQRVRRQGVRPVNSLQHPMSTRIVYYSMSMYLTCTKKKATHFIL